MYDLPLIRIGFLTIGQSPRVDVTRDFVGALGGKVEIVERGALDGMSREDVEEKLRPEPNHTIYTSRMRDGSQVIMSKEKIIPMLQEKISELEKLVDMIVILCSGEFPEFTCKKPIVYPEKLLKSYAEGVKVEGRVGVLIPLPEQVSYAEEKWSTYYKDLIVKPISPYSSLEREFYKVGEVLSRSNVEMTIMDCIGYTLKHKMIVREVTGKPVISTRGVVLRALEEIVG